MKREFNISDFIKSMAKVQAEIYMEAYPSPYQANKDIEEAEVIEYEEDND